MRLKNKYINPHLTDINSGTSISITKGQGAGKYIWNEALLYRGSFNPVTHISLIPGQRIKFGTRRISLYKCSSYRLSTVYNFIKIEIPYILVLNILWNKVCKEDIPLSLPFSLLAKYSNNNEKFIA